MDEGQQKPVTTPVPAMPTDAEVAQAIGRLIRFAAANASLVGNWEVIVPVAGGTLPVRVVLGMGPEHAASLDRWVADAVRDGAIPSAHVEHVFASRTKDM